ncbi:hypothetical protein KP77_08450 [Jeotgalibacillus alimentarius]|uniref:Aminoglycoside phosphotransferase domain-containing protein n=1 Tax=Jeotgalibacillus alimentarius TaxID=135826 RepID=A0A0C2W5M1_9BACL|nr:phosphotransferase [Jeotgalibacillus alimentarius]KIL51333.1 hypothetical protein KP77_08450 [Jeotgalibacillus alimentarius]
MEQSVERLFSHELLTEAASRFGTDAAQAKNLNGFENYVYEVSKNGVPYVLRLTHSSHRTKTEVESELLWINDLHSRGINVSLVNESVDGDLVVEIPAEDTYFYACLFNKAPGSLIKMDDPAFDVPLFEKWGEITGELHTAAKDFDTARIDRPHWYEDDLIELAKYLSEDDQHIIEGNRDLVGRIRQLPTDQQVYGLIHSDIHMGNFFVDEGELHLFDFDDTMYFHYVSDIAIPLYYTILWKHNHLSLEERSEQGEKFLKAFLSGYMRKSNIDQEWIERLPLFLKMRDYTLYGVFHKQVDLEQASEREQALVSSLRERLLKEEPIVEMDFARIYDEVKGVR